MLDVLNLALPFFGLILLGLVCGRLNRIPESGLAWMGFFIVYPQVRVAIVPGLGGYLDFLRGQSWVRPLQPPPHVNVTSTSPSPSSSIRTWSPALSHTVFTRLPGITIWPAVTRIRFAWTGNSAFQLSLRRCRRVMR